MQMRVRVNAFTKQIKKDLSVCTIELGNYPIVSNRSTVYLQKDEIEFLLVWNYL